MRPGICAAIAALICLLTYAPAAITGYIADADSDLVPDVFDNCSLNANGPNDPHDQTDTDGDGFGNSCDCDYTQDGVQLGNDVVQLFDAFNTSSPVHDNTGDGFVLGDDIVFCFGRFSGGPGPGPTAI